MRKPRFKPSDRASAVFHCISRIVAGEFLLAPDPVKETLRRMMRRQAAFCGIQIITYSLMSNHFHLLLRVPKQPDLSDRDLLERVRTFYGKQSPESLRIAESIAIGGAVRDSERSRLLKRMNDVSVMMKELKQGFSIWFNRKNNRFGTLWAERFRSILVEDQAEVVRTVAAYIDLNPVRAGMVNDPLQYRFCGYTEAASGNPLAVQGIGSFLEASDGTWRSVAGEYRETLFGKSGASGVPEGNELEKIREIWNARGKLSRPQALRLHIRYFTDGAVLGSRLFVDEMFEKHRDRFGPKRTSGARTLRRLPFQFLRILRALRVSAVK
jgi:putative transposase